MRAKRVFLIVMDSFGIGEAPDAAAFGDCGSNTLATVASSPFFYAPNLERLGLFHIDGVKGGRTGVVPLGGYGRLAEASMGKDSTIGHWEMAGLISPNPLPVYPEGFPKDILRSFERETGRGILCNRPYSGTEVLEAYGREQEETGKWIVYTSADSVFQVAAHEERIPLEELYQACRTARRLFCGKDSVGRVIARPYVGSWPHYQRTGNRHDYSIAPPGRTILDCLKEAGLETRSVGKIQDIFAGRGISRAWATKSNREGMERTMEQLGEDFTGLCFTNLVDFDTDFGHRNDTDGYARAVSEFDAWLGAFLEKMRPEDALLITADHGCDPGAPGTDHTREHVFCLAYGAGIRKNANFGTRDTFADIGATVLELLGVKGNVSGVSLLGQIGE